MFQLKETTRRRSYSGTVALSQSSSSLRLWGWGSCWPPLRHTLTSLLLPFYLFFFPLPRASGGGWEKWESVGRALGGHPLAWHPSLAFCWGVSLYCPDTWWITGEGSTTRPRCLHFVSERGPRSSVIEGPALLPAGDTQQQLRPGREAGGAGAHEGPARSAACDCGPQRPAPGNSSSEGQTDWLSVTHLAPGLDRALPCWQFGSASIVRIPGWIA